MADIIPFDGYTTVPMSPEDILEKAKDWNLAEVLILGWSEAGGFVFGGSHCEIAGHIHLCEKAKFELLKATDGR